MALLVRGIRWRRWASLVLVLCAALTVAGAAAGPIWGRAAQVSLLDRTLQDAPVSGLAWVVSGDTDSSRAATGSIERPEPGVVADDVRAESGLPADLERLLDDPTETVSTVRRLAISPIEAATPGPSEDPDRAAEQAPLGRLVGRDGACEQVDIVSGGCPAEPDGLLLSDRSATELGVVAGDRVLLPDLAGEPPPPDGPDVQPGTFTVSGVYRADTVRTASRFWFDTEELSYAPAVALGGDRLPARLDAVLVPTDLVLSLRTVDVRVQVEQVLRPGAVTLTEADRVAGELTARADDLAGTSRTVEASASAAATVAASVPGRRLVADTATFVGLQVVVLGWVVLFGLVAVNVGAREDELALAKLRGLRGPRLRAHALLEPVALVLAALPPGLAGAWVAVRLLADRVLLPGTPVVVPAAAWTAVAATAAGAVLACALAARRAVRAPVADQLRGQAPAAATASPVVTAVLVTLVSVGLVLVLTLGRGAGGALPALLTPVLGGLASGLLVGHAVRILLRFGVTRTHRWRLGPYLAVRQLARRTSLTRTTALVTAATAVSGFAAGAYVVTAEQRDAQARLDVGAERVVHVRPTTTSDLLDATREIDTGGRWAMAAVQRGTGTEALLAVDSSRFGAAFVVPGGALASPGGLAGLVPDGLAEPLQVRGTTATLEIAGFTTDRADIEISVQLRLVTAEGEVTTAVLGTLDQQERTLSAELPECAAGCTVAGVLLPRTSGSGAFTGSLTLVELEVGGASYPFVPGDWRSSRVDETVPDSATTGRLRALGGPGDGLVLGFGANPSATPGILRRDVPTELPVVLDDQTSLRLLGTRDLVEGTALEGGDVPFTVIGRTPVVPRSGGGAVVDLELVSRVEPPRSEGLDFQVWLGPDAPDDAPDRLAALGLEVVEVRSRADRREVLDRGEPARAQLLLLGAGATTLLAGVAGVASTLAASARRRGAESAALRAMGVPGRVVRGSMLLENLVLLLPGVAVGAVCAAGLVLLCGPVLAEVTGTSSVVADAASPTAAVLPALAVAVGICLLLVPVVLAVTRRGDDETRLRAGT